MMPSLVGATAPFPQTTPLTLSLKSSPFRLKSTLIKTATTTFITKPVASTQEGKSTAGVTTMTRPMSGANPFTDNDNDGFSIECDFDCDDNDPELNTADYDGDGLSTCDGDCIDFDALTESLTLMEMATLTVLTSTATSATHSFTPMPRVVLTESTKIAMEWTMKPLSMSATDRPVSSTYLGRQSVRAKPQAGLFMRRQTLTSPQYLLGTHPLAVSTLMGNPLLEWVSKYCGICAAEHRLSGCSGGK